MLASSPGLFFLLNDNERNGRTDECERIFRVSAHPFRCVCEKLGLGMRLLICLTVHVLLQQDFNLSVGLCVLVGQ